MLKLLRVPRELTPDGWLYASSTSGVGLVPEAYVEVRVHDPTVRRAPQQEEAQSTIAEQVDVDPSMGPPLADAGVSHSDQPGGTAPARSRNRLLPYAMRVSLGDEHPSTLASISNEVSLLQDQGRLDEAALLFQKALDTMRATLGDQHPDTLTSINDLAMLLKDLGRLEEAAPLVEESLSGMRATLGDRHPDTLSSIGNMAALKHDQGDLQGARVLFDEVVTTGREVLGGDHWRVQSWVLQARAVALHAVVVRDGV